MPGASPEYCLQVTLKNRLMIHAPALTPVSVFDKLSTIQMVDVWIPMLDGRWLVLPRHTQPEPDVQDVFRDHDFRDLEVADHGRGGPG